MDQDLRVRNNWPHPNEDLDRESNIGDQPGHPDTNFGEGVNRVPERPDAHLTPENPSSTQKATSRRLANAGCRRIRYRNIQFINTVGTSNKRYTATPFERLDHPIGFVAESNRVCETSNRSRDIPLTGTLYRTTLKQEYSLRNHSSSNRSWTSARFIPDHTESPGVDASGCDDRDPARCRCLDGLARPQRIVADRSR